MKKAEQKHVIGLDTKIFAEGAAALYDDCWWRVLPAEYRSSTLAWRARKALVKVFGDEWLREQSVQSHPLGYQSLWRFGRWRVFRLGLALDRLEISPGTAKRLRHAEQYQSCAMELDFGLFLVTASGRVQHEPTEPKRGPDFVTQIGGTTIAFEVKSPRVSQDLVRLQRAAGELSMELQRAANDSAGVSGWAIEYQVSAERLARAAFASADADELKLILKTATTRWATRPRAGRHQADVGARLIAQRWPVSGVQVSGPAFSGTPAHELARLERHVLDAADQLSRVDVPGFIVFAGEQSGLLQNHLPGILELLRTHGDPTVRRVAGLIVYDLEPSQSALVPTARIFVRAGAEPLAQALARLQARVAVRFHRL